MKIRTGFVSNSSSSSFIVLVEEDKYNKFVETLDQYQKQVLEYIEPCKTSVFNIDAIEITGSSGNYSSFEDCSLDISDEDQQLIDDEEFDKIQEKYGYNIDDGAGECFHSIKWPDGTFQTYIDM